MRNSIFVLVIITCVSCSSRPKDDYVKKMIVNFGVDYYFPLKVKFHDTLYIGIISSRDFRQLISIPINLVPKLIENRLYDYKNGIKIMKFSKAEYKEYKDCLIKSNTEIIDTSIIFNKYSSVVHYDSTMHFIHEKIPVSLYNQIVYSLVKNNYSCFKDCETGLTLVSKLNYGSEKKED